MSPRGTFVLALTLIATMVTLSDDGLAQCKSIRCERVTKISDKTENRLYLEPDSEARRQIEEWRHLRPKDAAVLEKIANQPQAIWLTDNYSLRVLRAAVSNIRMSHSLPVIVLYNIPDRDLGGHSKGGAESAEAYREWIDEVDDILSDLPAIIIVEPDALADMRDDREVDVSERIQLLKYAIETLARLSSRHVYIDAGHPEWYSAEEIAKRLIQAHVSMARGFALNVSNFVSTDDNIKYGMEISKFIGDKHFVIDTSRNGRGPKRTAGGDIDWCNPEGRALGKQPTLNTGHALVDAFLWIKSPGESDGTCNNGPEAGEWWGEYALGLASRADW
jgi:endoglucanase